MESHVKIFLDSVEVPLKIGLYDHEQDTPQRVIVDVALFACPQSYLKSVKPDTIIDYSIVYNRILSWAERPQVPLIEDYLKELTALCFENEAVTAVRIAINKADVFGKGQGAGVEIFMKREEWGG